MAKQPGARPKLLLPGLQPLISQEAGYQTRMLGPWGFWMACPIVVSGPKPCPQMLQVPNWLLHSHLSHCCLFYLICTPLLLPPEKWKYFFAAGKMQNAWLVLKGGTGTHSPHASESGTLWSPSLDMARQGKTLSGKRQGQHQGGRPPALGVDEEDWCICSIRRT